MFSSAPSSPSFAPRSDAEATVVDALSSLRSSSASAPVASAAAASDSNTVVSSDEGDKPILTMDDFVDIEKAHYTFPERLMELLEGEKVKEAMWWLPGGCAFAIRPKIFYDVVLSKYFQGTKFESFTRKLNRWGFRRLASQGVPQSTVAYYNKMFKQGQPQLVKHMRSGNKGGKFQQAEKPPRLAAATAKSPPSIAVAAAPEFATSGESAEVKSLRDYLKNQSIINARQSQQVASLHHQAPKEQQLLASLQAHHHPAFPSAALLGRQENLVAMQRRARMQAAQQFVATNGAASVNDLRDALFSRAGMGLLDNVPPNPVLPSAGALNPQLLQLLLLRERLGQQPGNL